MQDTISHRPRGPWAPCTTVRRHRRAPLRIAGPARIVRNESDPKRSILARERSRRESRAAHVRQSTFTEAT